MKVGDKIISLRSWVCDIWDPSCPLVTFAQIEEDMEGIITEFLNQEETIVSFYGIEVIVENEEFFDGTFSLLKDKSKLRLIVTAPNKSH